MIKNQKKIMAGLLFALSLVTIVPANNAFAETSTITEEERQDYLDFIKNKCTPMDDKILYYNSKDGKYYAILVTGDGPQKPKSRPVNYYYTNEDGSIIYNQWKQVSVNDKQYWRYYGSDGKCVQGYQTINGKKYYFMPKYEDNTNSYLKTNWWRDDNYNWYYSYPDGSIKEGWLNYNGNWYYIYSDGLMAKDTTTPDGYRVNSKGVWVS
ncbi:glucan-binding YG repeat protein [Clostridium beijerinckii]|uniref:hypothetical protein n=1 Tax=Clostridium beijerinckii TaxID=1520 RepID=UPI001493E21B|nr:hypothetical protein [Clostridium beijerinckii]NOW84921.1 glucan-binding YG repeat protein [Clostridium beijerinckii]